MLNYGDLNDVEFEELCLDIMSRKLKIELRTYAAGRDGGIDIADNHTPHETLIRLNTTPRVQFLF